MCLKPFSITTAKAKENEYNLLETVHKSLFHKECQTNTLV